MKNRTKQAMRLLSHRNRVYAGIIALVLPLLAACGADDSVPDIPQGAIPVGFSTQVEGRQTRSGALTSDNLLSTGIWAYSTGSDDWTVANMPNFMYNQEVKRNNASSPWTYSPVKYWPNNPTDKISFFAYAPYNAAGVTLSANTVAGFPYIDYTVAMAEADQTDLLAATPLMNQSYSSNPDTPGNIKFTMQHALTKITIYAKSNDLGAGKVVNSLSVTAPKSGRLTYKADGFSWHASTDKSTYTATKTDINVDPATADETVLLGTFYLIPDRANSSLNMAYTVTGSISDNVNSPTDKPVITGQSFPDTYDWLPGTSIVYTVNIARTGLTIVAESSSMEWTGSSTNEIELYAPKQLKLGDYYYSDGSWSDGGLMGMDRTTNTRIWKSPLPGPDLTNPETSGTRKCIGVIFAVEGDDVITDPTTVKAMVVAPKDEKTNQQCYPSTGATTADFPPPGGVLSSEWYHTDEKTLRWMAKGDGSTATYLREIVDEHLMKIENGAKLEGPYWVHPYTVYGASRYVMNLSSGSYYEINYLHLASFRVVLNVLK